MGLPDSERISTIRIHPEDGQIVYICATGHLWDANEERGLFKTTDGGETWEKILYVDENTGCADIDMDPQEPDILYAGMWQFRRYPDFFESGGPGSGFYRSEDGGANWNEDRKRHARGRPRQDCRRDRAHRVRARSMPRWKPKKQRFTAPMTQEPIGKRSPLRK